MAVEFPYFEVTGEITKGGKRYKVLNTVTWNRKNVKLVAKNPSVHSLVTKTKLKLITDPKVIYEETKKWNSDPKPRCPYCRYIETNNHVPTLAAGIPRGYGYFPRFLETSRFCPACSRTYVKGRVVEVRYT